MMSLVPAPLFSALYVYGTEIPEFKYHLHHLVAIGLATQPESQFSKL